MRQAVTSHLGHVRVIFCYEQKGIGPNLPVSTSSRHRETCFIFPGLSCLPLPHMTLDDKSEPSCLDAFPFSHVPGT